MKGTIKFPTLSFAIESVSNKREALWAAAVLPSTKAFRGCPVPGQPGNTFPDKTDQTHSH